MTRALQRLPVALTIALSVPVVSMDAQEVGLPVGADAPAVQLEDLEGHPFDLGELIGRRPVLLEFWATWCGQCAKLAPKVAAAQERYGDKVDFVIVAIAVNQTVRRVARHFEDDEHGYTVVWDGRGEAVRAYKVPTTAVVMVVDSTGRISYTGVGPDQDLDTALAAVVDQD